LTIYILSFGFKLWGKQKFLKTFMYFINNDEKGKVIKNYF